MAATAPAAARPFGAFVTWGRCVRLLGSSPRALFVIAINAALLGLRRELWDVYAFFVVLSFGLLAERHHIEATKKLEYLQALPLRGSSRTLLALPEILFAGLVVAVVALLPDGFGPLHALTLWGCCAWAIAATHFLPIRSVLRFPVWLAIASLGPFVAFCAYGTHAGDGAGWRRAAIAAVVVAGLGFALTPRELRRRLARPTTQIPVGESFAAAAGTVARFRPSNRRVGFARLWRLSSPRQSLWLVVLYGIVVILIQTALLWSSNDDWRRITAMIVVWPMMFGNAVATATSRSTIEFLATRPLRRSRLFVATVVPWFALALVPPLLVFLRERSALPSPGVGPHDLSAHLALASLAIMFCACTQSTRPGRIDWVSVLSLATAMGIGFWIVLSRVAQVAKRHPLPALPLWALAAIAVASGAIWYRRSLRRALALD